VSSCSKCSGFVVRERDIWGWYTRCLQCGRHICLTVAGTGELVDEHLDLVSSRGSEGSRRVRKIGVDG
jgi:hypothetical protein